MKYLTPTDLEAALRGEIEGLIYHNPTDEEMELFERDAADYIAICIEDNKKPDLSGLACALLDCRNDNFRACADCGDYYLWSEMNPDDKDYCCKCKPIYDPDYEWKQAQADRDYVENLDEIG